MNNRYILYVDDNAEQLELVQHLLERELPGVIVEVCCTSAGAESFLNHRCYDAVILDVNLPGELGTDIAEKILARDPQQPIYLMSEYTGADVRAAAARIGLELQPKFSQKPANEFVKDIRALLSLRPCDEPAAKAPGSLGDSADTGRIGEPAETRETSSPARGNSADRISSRPAKEIRLTSPYVLAARASFV